jgi:hypothetical protein
VKVSFSAEKQEKTPIRLSPARPEVHALHQRFFASFSIKLAFLPR